MRVLELGLVLALGATLAVRCAALPLRIEATPAAGREAPQRGCAHKSSDIARSADEICGELPVEDALRKVMMAPDAAHKSTGLLTTLGFRTRLDLELLGGGEAAAEVLAELKVGGLSPGDRAKVRLLMGDQKHLHRLSSLPSSLPERPNMAADADGGPAWSATVNSNEHDESADGAPTTSSSNGRRALQGNSGAEGGISADTLAVVLSMLVGAVGYVVQAHTARRSQQAQAEQAMQAEAAEQRRQREHQMMTAQISRASQALDKCCRPVLDDLVAISLARMTVIQQIVCKLEVSHPATVEQMRLSCLSHGALELQPGDKLVSKSTGRVAWKPTTPGITQVMSACPAQAPSAIAALISGTDLYMSFSNAYCADMPVAILDIVVTEPEGEIANMYRGYVRHTMMPLVRRVADTLREYAAYMEFPPKDWLQKTYPDETWRSFSNTLFVSSWQSYASSFERVLFEWSNGNFTPVGPGNTQPMGALMRTLTWSQGRAEDHQAELIGMTAKAEIDHDIAFSRLEATKERHGLETSADVKTSYDMPLSDD